MFCADPVRIWEKTHLHGQIITSLQRNRPPTVYLFSSNRNRNTDLPGHGCTTDDGFVETEFCDEGADRADVGFFVVRVVAGNVVTSRKRAAVGGEVEGDHGGG